MGLYFSPRVLKDVLENPGSLEPKRVENWRDGTLRNIFYILRQRLNEPGMDFYSRGSDLYENLPVEIVDITDADGLTVTVHFSQLTKLPVRQFQVPKIDFRC